ncbi:putative 26s proteasome non-atpase regulatory subunit 3 [Phaeomoniella chlamydospora]|uniref:Putative 26s proteasome non-atpase regulatory subunit 3 n=1 Tax=Phaeomoniella chlamydospora TaxID=158046 RepID=A0A0G2DVS4_PHACM|nr:putative 26s proteasome non-atpase regulatory subunit 3 [Phaeomoniella chlamydospora]
MPVDRRSLRSNSSTNSEKPRSDSHNSSNKDRPGHSRSNSSKNKNVPTKKAAAEEMSGDKQTNGSDPVENGINGTQDTDMGGDKPKTGGKTIKDKDGDDEMTVVVPPSKTQKLFGASDEDPEGDVAMNGTEASDLKPAEVVQDPHSKAVSDIKANFVLLERAVSQFDPRFTLRVLRNISSVRKHLTSAVIANVVNDTYPQSNSTAKFLLEAIGQTGYTKTTQGKPSTTTKEILAEIDVYLAILCQIYLFDNKAIEQGIKFSDALVDRLRTLNRRTMDSLAARAYFYYSLFYEQKAPLPPSPIASVISIRQPLLAALRTSVLRKDQDIQATVTTLLLRNYLSTSHITQADLLVSHTEFSSAASNNQVARYLYYLGRIRAIQLSYTEAHEHLIGATRKSPTTYNAGGFYQASHKLLIVVELLMGDIPDRAIFRQPSLERALAPYLELVQAVSAGDLDSFLTLVQKHNATFRRDGTYTLILRLRQNVIKTGIRMMSLSYSRISLRDICLRLGLDSEESAEYIVAKAIRDGVIEATIDHERGFMKSKEVGDVYTTREPGEAFHDRIRACLTLHDESVKAMRFPMNQHRLELKNAQEARERERELAKEIQEGEMDDDDAGGDFEGM